MEYVFQAIGDNGTIKQSESYEIKVRAQSKKVVVVPVVEGGLQLYWGTYGQYKKAVEAGLTEQDSFYFTSDSKQLYLGNDLVCQPYIIVDDLPTENILEDRLYLIEDTNQVYFYRNNNWVKLIRQVDSIILDSPLNDENLPNIKAIKDYLGKYNIPDATTEVKGKVQLASNAESFSGDNELKGVTPAGLKYAIEHNIVGAVTYKGSINSLEDITLPVQAGDMFKIATKFNVSRKRLFVGDFIIFNKEVTESITNSDFDIIRNVEDEDLVRLNDVQILTNKTIDAENNTFRNIGLTNLKDGTVVNSFDNASDTNVPTAKLVKDSIKSSEVLVEDTNTIGMKKIGNIITSDIKTDSEGNVNISASENGVKVETRWIGIV